MAETIVLDPAEVAPARTELDISTGAIRVQAASGVDWGDAEIAGYMAEQNRGEAPVDFRVPNRHIAIPLIVQTSGTVSFTQARQKLQSKVARLQQEGGWLKRVTSNAGTVFMDVVNATLHLPGGWMQANREMEHEATLTLEALPDFYGAELTLSDHVETTAAELVFTETSLKGNYPARVRLVVDNDQAADQLGLVWGFRSRNYSSASTAATKYEAEALQALDAARILALAGASGGTAVTHGTISTNWTPIVGTNVAGTGYLTHTGTNRIYARVYSTSGTLVQTRFVWDVGDLTLPAENPAVRLPGASNFYICDLGEVRLDPAPVGTHRWQGQVQAKGNLGNENFSVDKVWIVNSDEGMGVLRASFNAGVGLSTYSARDEFNQAAGTLTGKTLPVGGTWAAVSGMDADDFSVVSGNKVQRTAVSDVAGSWQGRMVGPSTPSLALVAASVDFESDSGSTLAGATLYQGFALRQVDSSNFLIVAASPNNYPVNGVHILASKFVAGVTTPLGAVDVPFGADTRYRLMTYVDAAGRVLVFFGSPGGSLSQVLAVQDTALATGGALASGKVNLFDQRFQASACTRTYANFTVWVPPADAAAFASQPVQLTTQGMYRRDSSGTAYGPVSQVVGDLPRLPPAGLEGRTTEVFLKGSRGDFDQLPDSALDDISCQVFYRPSWLFIPE